MSFILDALKKSELERQRQSAPGLSAIPAPTGRRGVPAWVWVLVGLLCATVAVLLVLLLRGGAPTDRIAANDPANAGARSSTDGQQEAPAGGMQRSAPSADHFSPMDNQPVYAPEIPVQEETAPTARSGTPGHTARRADAGRADAGRADAGRTASGPADADPVLKDEPPEDEELLPSISELNLTGNQSLPDIHLDVHVYASRPADRFVYINMRKYREGAALQEGPTLERIRRDGVVLNYNGLRFFVPRQ